MPVKKRFFKHTQKTIGNKSVNIREKRASVAPQAQESKRFLGKMPLSPKIPQVITEPLLPVTSRFQNESVLFWVVLLGIAIIILISLAGCLVLVREALRMSQVISQRMTLRQEMKLWEDISNKYPTYRDADFQVAILAYRLGDVVKEGEYLRKT